MLPPATSGSPFTRAPRPVGDGVSYNARVASNIREARQRRSALGLRASLGALERSTLWAPRAERGSRGPASEGVAGPAGQSPLVGATERSE
jgi:hypothetical protein